MDKSPANPFATNQGRSQQQQRLDASRTKSPAFQLRQSRQSPSTMNELDSLRVRTIELETELRLTKQQLLRAQSGTQYLVNCFANQQHRGPGSESGQDLNVLDSRTQELETEVHHLKDQLLLQQREKTRHVTPQNQGFRRNAGGCDLSKERELAEEVAELKSQRASLLSDVLRLLGEDANECSFRFDDGDPAIYKPLDHFKDASAALAKKQTSLLEGDLLGESQNLRSPSVKRDRDEKGEVDSSVLFGTAPMKKPSIYIKPRDMALLDLSPVQQAKPQPQSPHHVATFESAPHSASLPSPQLLSETVVPDLEFGQPLDQYPPTPPYGREEHRGTRKFLSFASWEHNHLMANATFVEEMDIEEYLHFWESLEADVRRFAGRHSKEDWKTYYEKTVRPMFLHKMAQRDAQAIPIVRKASVTEAKGEVGLTSESGSRAQVQRNEEARSTVQEDRSEQKGRRADTPVSRRGVHGDTVKAEDVGSAPTAVEASHTEQVAEKVFLTASPSKEIAVTTNARAEDVHMQHEAQLTGHADAPASATTPAFGSFGSRIPQAPSEPIAPIPGLAGGWPQPVPRRNPRIARRSPVTTAERDPGTWNQLFYGIERRSDKRFILGRNEKLLRTVIITGVPVGCTLDQVVDQVRGGKIVSARFSDTARMATEPPVTTNTVLVEFVGSQRAKAFVEHCEEHPVCLKGGDGGDEVESNTQLIQTQTLPLPQALLTDLLRTEGALTRVLFVILANRESAPTAEALAREITSFGVKYNYSDVPKKPLRITSTEEGMLLFEYANVRQAAAAWNVVAALEWKLGEISKGFAADPCGRHFEQAVEGEGEKEGVNALEIEKEQSAAAVSGHGSNVEQGAEEGKWLVG